MKKFIQHQGKKVTLIHYMPFDEVHGFHKSEEELLQMGELVDEVPEPEIKPGFYAEPRYDELTKTIFYEYIKEEKMV